MDSGGLDVPIQRQFVQRDWRFGHYELEGLQDPVSCLVRSLGNIFLLGRQRKSKEQQKSSPDYPRPARVLSRKASGNADKAALAGAGA